MGDHAVGRRLGLATRMPRIDVPGQGVLCACSQDCGRRADACHWSQLEDAAAKAKPRLSLLAALGESRRDKEAKRVAQFHSTVFKHASAGEFFG